MLLAMLTLGWGSGCAMLETANPTSTQPTALSWLTNWVSQPIEMAPGFDVEEIKPSPAPPTVAPQNVLEVTVWDLYEPGKPYSYPVRVSDNYKIDVPMLGEVGVENRTIAQVESALVAGFRDGEYLQNPRVIVRSLDAAMIKVQVTGAVNRPGYVELTKADRSAYAAILSAGGLNRMAGTQVAVTRAAVMGALEQTVDSQSHPAIEPAAAQPAPVTENGGEDYETYESHAPVQRANTVEDLSVSPEPPKVRPSPDHRGMYSVFDSGFTGAADTTRGPSGNVEPGLDEKPSGPATSTGVRRPVRPAAGQEPAMISDDARRVRDLDPLRARMIPEGSAYRSAGKEPTLRKTGPRVPNVPAQPVEPVTVWYDISHARERDLLKTIVLSEGDVVTVKTAAQPLRIGGIVNRSGAYPLPSGRSINVWQAIELAGGVRDENVPLNITLLRPAAEGRGARRWFLSIANYEQHPPTSPLVEPGDELHVEPTTGSKIKRVVRDVWSKP